MKKLIILSLFLCFILGCNNYTKFYTDYTGDADISASPFVVMPTDEPVLIQGQNVDDDMKRMLENGYLLLGVSSFNAGAVNQRGAIEQAKLVNADTVIVYSGYSNTVSGSLPLTTPNTQTSTGFHSGSIYGSGGGYANYSGTSYTTTYGSQTTYIPYAVRRYDYYASYWVKMENFTFGVYYEDLTDEHRKAIESNKGIYLTTIIKNSPAFNNDFLPDDIIRRVNGVEIIDKSHFQNLFHEIEGKNVEFEIIRNGKTIVKEMFIELPGQE